MLVSTIVPTYNRAHTIVRTLESALAQTWPSIEIIVVDDGSTDDTQQVLRPYENRIKIIRQRNGGPSAAKNAGIKAANGQIIAFLDSDDCWLPDKIARQVRLLERTKREGVTCCVTNATMMFSAGTTTSFDVAGLRPTAAEGVWMNPAEVLTDRFLLFNQVVAIRREAVEQVGEFREDLPYGLNEDYDFALRLSVLGPWSFIADPLLLWQEHGGNISSTLKQRDLCFHTMRIFEDLKKSPRWGPKLPQRHLRRRLRRLKQQYTAFELGTRATAAAKLIAPALHFYVRASSAFSRRLRLRPQMISRPA